MASWVALATLSFSFSLSLSFSATVGVALPLMITVGARSFLVGFASLLALLAALACAASLALLAFFSLIYWTRGVMVTGSVLDSPDSVPFAEGFVMGSVKLCRKSINSWSWSIVPCRPSCRIRPLGVLLYGANSSDGGPRRHGSLVVFLASWNVDSLISAESVPSSDCSLTLRYALAGRDGFAGLDQVSSS
jgi:hypothetical protein